jgi:motility quorum-sensing regulator / GCU-specific mRNA interferase toxin
MVAYFVMEKRRSTYDLDAVKVILSNVDSLSITVSAFSDALKLGFDRQSIADIMATIDRKMFYKSMTTFADHRVWQDVYHVPVDDIFLYIKFQADVITEFKIMSFKEQGQ